MTEPVFHEGHWWFRHPNGAWSRWDAASDQWVLHAPVPYAPLTQAPRRYSPLRGLAKWIRVALVIDMAMSVITVVVNARHLATFERSERIGIEDYIEASIGPQIVMQLGGALSAVAGLLFVIWFHRAYQNLEALRTRGRYGSGWALGAWFVPVLNLWRPKQIADDIWRSSDPTLPTEPGTPWLDKKVDPLLNWWWALWVVANTVALLVWPVAFFAELNGSDFIEPGSSEPSFTPFIRSFSIAMIATSAARALTAPLAILTVKRMTERQEARATQLGVPREV